MTGYELMEMFHRFFVIATGIWFWLAYFAFGIVVVTVTMRYSSPYCWKYIKTGKFEPRRTHDGYIRSDACKPVTLIVWAYIFYPIIITYYIIFGICYFTRLAVKYIFWAGLMKVMHTLGSALPDIKIEKESK